MSIESRFRAAQRAARIWPAALVCFTLCGCGEPSLPPPTLGVDNWKPSSVGGPLEVRPIPPASQVIADHQAWVEFSTAAIARLYEIVLKGASNQHRFAVEIRRGETPMGRPQHTYASFVYQDPTNGAYELLWDRLGPHNADFLRLDDRPKRAWVTLNGRASTPGLPLLEIEACEGLKPDGVLLAEPGGERR
jgi:hypothetical protein